MRSLRFRIGTVLLAAGALASGSIAGSVEGNPPSVSAAHAAASNTVIDGNARFQVLTPTLIRLEYAGDGAFQDRATFTAVNRSFPAVPFTTRVNGGYREIVTSAVTLRHKQNSGAVYAG
jgi:hypothetical protein